MQLINKKTLLGMIPLSERTIYDMEQRGTFPRRIVLNARSVAWDMADVQAWVEQRKAAGGKAARPGRELVA